MQERRSLYNAAIMHNQVLGDVEFVRAEGSLVFDASGRDYVDFYGNGCLPLGHDSRILRDAFARDLPLNVGLYPTPERRLLTEALREIMPGYGSYQFYSSGTAANEGMLRYAMGLTGRSSFCGFEGSFHGRSKALASVSDLDSFNGRRIDGYLRLPFPGYDPETGGYRDSRRVTIGEIAARIDSHWAGDLAGLVIEPVLSKPVIEPPPGWLRQLKEEVLDPRGILLLADEYLTSGRVGSWIACVDQNVRPDVFSFGKCFTAGIPFGGIACLDRHEERVAIVKGSDSFGGQPAICEIVLGTLQAYEAGGLLKRSLELAEAFRARFEPMTRRESILRVEAKGALFGIDLSSRELAVRVGRACIEERVLLSAIKSGLRLTPALTMDRDVLEEGFRRVIAAIERSARE